MARQGGRRDRAARDAFYRAAAQMHPATLRECVAVLTTLVESARKGQTFEDALGEAVANVATGDYGDNWRRRDDTGEPGTACFEPGPLNDRCGLLRGHAGRHIGHAQGLSWRDAEEARDIELYGPEGARWGDKSKPCPYVGTVGPCALRLNHAGPHLDGNGDEMAIAIHVHEEIRDDAIGLVGQMFTIEYTAEHAGDPYATRVQPADACTCGNPAAHDPTCPRYARTTGAPEGGTETNTDDD